MRRSNFVGVARRKIRSKSTRGLMIRV